MTREYISKDDTSSQVESQSKSKNNQLDIEDFQNNCFALGSKKFTTLPILNGSFFYKNRPPTAATLLTTRDLADGSPAKA